MMPVKRDASGNRYVQVEAEVPGTPEEVWQAISTGPGVSSWFVPTRIDGRIGGAVIASFGPGMNSTATISSWEPPRRFVANSPGGPSDPIVATEWTVEGRAGGTCIVRVVHSWFASSEEWDNQFEGVEHGWPAFFRILRLYLAHFRGQSRAVFQLMAMAPEPTSTAWNALTRPLGLADVTAGQRVNAPDGAPPLAGVIERVSTPEFPELLIQLDEPAPGIGHLLAMPMGGSICLAVRLYFYGDRAAGAVERNEPLWQAWMNAHFPSHSDANTAAQESR